VNENGNLKLLLLSNGLQVFRWSRRTRM